MRDIALLIGILIAGVLSWGLAFGAFGLGICIAFAVAGAGGAVALGRYMAQGHI